MRVLTTSDLMIIWHSVLPWPSSSSTCWIYSDVLTGVEANINGFYTEFPPKPIKEGSGIFVDNKDGTVTAFSTVLYLGRTEAQAIFMVTNGKISKIEAGKKNFLPCKDK